MPRVSFSWNGKKHKDFVRLTENINSKKQRDEFSWTGSYEMPPDTEKKKNSMINVCRVELNKSETIFF